MDKLRIVIAMDAPETDEERTKIVQCVNFAVSLCAYALSAKGVTVKEVPAGAMVETNKPMNVTVDKNGKVTGITVTDRGPRGDILAEALKEEYSRLTGPKHKAKSALDFQVMSAPLHPFRK